MVVLYECLSMITHPIVYVDTYTRHKYTTLAYMSKLCNKHTFSRYIILMYQSTTNGTIHQDFDVSFTRAWGHGFDVSFGRYITIQLYSYTSAIHQIWCITRAQRAMRAFTLLKVDVLTLLVRRKFTRSVSESCPAQTPISSQGVLETSTFQSEMRCDG